MNALGRVLQTAIEAEEKKEVPGRYRLKYHLMPPVGWLNDPNGLCQFRGEYHVFFQYTPFDAEGGLKVWGHYVSKDLLHWNYLGTPILPDEAWDCHGAYSGTALVENDEMVLFYTGNVKYPGEYDYISDGRGSNTIRLTTKDGRVFSEKQCVLENKDYPDTYTAHIRDPKVIKRGDTYYMFLGGRKMDDHGAILLYASKDQVNWTYKKELTTKEPFGYMWECPNLIESGEDWFLVFSPQGLKRGEYENQNVYQSGYQKGNGDYLGEYSLGEFVEWDHGFDFYAPQTFTDEQGRTLLIGWVGLPDIEEEYVNETLAEGWQHALTVPREIIRRGEKLYQYPAEELKGLRGDYMTLKRAEEYILTEASFDLEIEGIKEDAFLIKITEELSLSYKQGEFQMKFHGRLGAGRTVRKAKMEEVHSLRILCDISLLEVYLNDGEFVFTTRFYNKEDTISVMANCEAASMTLWQMNEMEIIKNKQQEAVCK